MKYCVGIVTVVFWCGFSLARAQQGDSLTAEEVVRRVLETHPAVLGAMQATEASRARVEQSRAAGLPFAEGNASYSRVGPVPEIDFGGEPFQLFPVNNYDAHISLRQTLYDFGRTRASVEASQAAVDAAADDVGIVRTNLAYQAVQNVYTILFLRQSIGIQQQQIDALNGHLDLSRKRVQTGSATDYDVITTQVRVSQAQNQKIDLQAELARQETALRRLMGLPVSAAVSVKGSFAPDTSVVDLAASTARALAQRPEVKQAHDAERQAELQENVVALRDRPSVNLNLLYGIKNGYIPDLDVLRGNWVAALGATLPIYNGSLTENQRQEAEANRRVAQFRSADLERTIASEVQQAAVDLQANRDKLQSAQLQIDQARQALDMARIRYQTGVITSLELVDAESALAQALLSQAQTVFRVQLSRLALQRASGEAVTGGGTQ